MAPKVYIRRPTGAPERLSREIVGLPDRNEFNLSACAKGHDHGFHLDWSGAGVDSCVWQLTCEGLAGDRCPLQRGTERSVEEGKVCSKLLADFTPRNEATKQVIYHLEKVAGALAVLESLGESPSLPASAAGEMSK
jgi:hypothetical protein